MSRRVRQLPLVLWLVVAGLLLGACGRNLEAGRSDRVLRIGMLLPLTGPVAVIGNPLAAGAQVWVDALNEEKGGVAGRHKVELVLRDSRNDPATAVQAYSELEREVVLFYITGVPVLEALLPQLEGDGGVAVAGTLDADHIREPNLIPVGVPYQMEAINILDYYLRTEAGHRGRTVCAMGGDEAAGQAAVEGVEYAARELGFEPSERAHYRLGDEDFTAQIRQLHDGGCNAVVLLSRPSETSRILGAAAQGGFSPRWLALTPTWAAALANSPLRQYLQDNFWLVREGAQYGDTSIPGMAEFLARIERHPPSLDVTEGDPRLISGYTQAQVMTAVLEQAVKEGDVSKEGILRAIPHVGTLSFDGLAPDYYYGPIEERGPDPVSTIFKVDPTQPFGLAPIQEGFKSGVAERFEPEPAE
ncbi:MAG: ABC transporter substrate-binding protein [Nitriliruptorales bacterium]